MNTNSNRSRALSGLLLATIVGAMLQSATNKGDTPAIAPEIVTLKQSQKTYTIPKTKNPKLSKLTGNLTNDELGTWPIDQQSDSIISVGMGEFEMFNPPSSEKEPTSFSHQDSLPDTFPQHEIDTEATEQSNASNITSDFADNSAAFRGPGSTGPVSSASTSTADLTSVDSLPSAITIDDSGTVNISISGSNDNVSVDSASDTEPSIQTRRSLDDQVVDGANQTIRIPCPNTLYMGGNKFAINMLIKNGCPVPGT